MQQIGTSTTNAKPNNQYVIPVKKDHSAKSAGLNTEDNRKMKTNYGTQRDNRNRHRQVDKK